MNAQCEAFFLVNASTPPNDNGYYSFMNQSGPMVNYTSLWNFGDGNTSNSNSPTHQYTAEGVFEVCLTIIVYEANVPVCTNTYCTTVTVDLPEPGCDEGEYPLTVTAVTCCVDSINNYLVYTITDDENNVILFDGIDLAGPPSVYENVHCLLPGCYHVQMDYSNMNSIVDQTDEITFSSPFMSAYTVISTWGNLPWEFTFCIQEPLPPCPTAIAYEQTSCGTFIFHLNEFPAQGNIVWNFGDGTNAGNTNNQTHTFSEPGTYEVCAIASTLNCTEGVEVCTTVVVEECNTISCPTAVLGTSIDCNTYLFTLPDINAGVAVWEFGDGSATSFGLNQEHTFADNGTYIVTVQYTGPTCPNVTTLVYTVLVNCPEGNDCPTQIFASPTADCHTWNFEVGSFVQGESVIWYYDNNGPNVAGHFTSHTFETNGPHVITIFYTSPLCPNGIQLVVTVLVECATEVNCPDAITSVVTNDCGVVHFEIGNFVQGESVMWYTGDGTGAITGGHFLSHTYTLPGTYQVCAFYTSPLCSDGVELCTTVIVPSCTDCFLELSAQLNVDGSYTFTANGTPAELPMHWNFGDGSSTLQATWVVDHNYANPGTYTICAWFDSEVCGVVEDCITIYVGEEICPNEITVSDEINCHQFSFAVNNWGESDFGNILWNFGDNEGYGQNNFMHMYLNPGEYQVCATGTTAACPSGFEICTSLNVDACGGDNNNDGCPDFIWGWAANDCGLYHFEAGAGQEGMTVSWNWGDGTPNTDATTIADHQFEVDGLYIVTLTYYSPSCQETITLVYTVQVNACEQNDCPTEIWSGAGAECGVMHFEAGGFVEGEQFTWYFGDGTSAQGGHFISHTYAEPGTYYVNCTLSNSLCAAWQLATVILVAPCEPTCTNVVIGIDSYINVGGPSVVYYQLSSINNNNIASGVAQYSSADPYFDYLVCLEDGCYTLEVEGLNVANQDFLDIFVTAEGNSLVQNVVVINDNLVQITFGVNSDCSPIVECNASFETIITNTPGHVEFINTSAMSGNEQWMWDYGNGTSGNTQNGNVWYTENGVYVVCLTVYDEGCTHTYCQTIEITNMGGECNYNEVTITITGENVNKLIDIVSFSLSLNNVSIENWTSSISGGFSYTGLLCLPDGCYNLQLSTQEPSFCTSIQVLATMNGIDIGSLQYLQGSVLESMNMSVNVNCEDNVNESETTNWIVYPNPASNSIQFSTNSVEKIMRVEIMDATGRMVKSIAQNGGMYDVSTLASGCYYARVVGEQSIAVLPLNIQK